MKLRLSRELTDDMRKLSSVYDIHLSLIARKAELACRRLKFVNIPTSSTVTVIDVTDDHTQDEWRGMIAAYVERELKNIDKIFKYQIDDARRNADSLRASLPQVIME